MARILVVEDELEVRETLGAILARAGHDVVEAENGEAGLERYREDPADLVLADVLMPVMTGSEIIRQLRSEFPDAKIVAISGGGPDMLQISLDSGADRVIAKPFGGHELLQILEELL